MGWPPPGVWLEAVVVNSSIPMTQGAGRKTQTASRLRALDALLCHLVAEVKDHPAGLVLCMAAVSTARRSKA
jgi:hypothetical protein